MKKLKKFDTPPAGIRMPDSWTKLSCPRFEFWREIRPIELDVLKKSLVYLFLLVGSSIVGNETIDGNQKNHDKKSRQDADSQCLPKQE